MAGGLVQLISKNQQDMFLTGKPTFSYFKNVYFRYTNFSIETKEYLVNANFNKLISFTIPNDGDLLKNVILQVQLPSVQVNDLDLEKIKWDYLNIAELPLIKPFKSKAVLSQVLDVEKKSLFKKRINDDLLEKLVTKIGNNNFLLDLVKVITTSNVFDTTQYLNNITVTAITFYKNNSSLKSQDSIVIVELLVNLLTNICNFFLQDDFLEINFLDTVSLDTNNLWTKYCKNKFIVPQLVSQTYINLNFDCAKEIFSKISLDVYNNYDSDYQVFLNYLKTKLETNFNEVTTVQELISTLSKVQHMFLDKVIEEFQKDYPTTFNELTSSYNSAVKKVTDLGETLDEVSLNLNYVLNYLYLSINFLLLQLVENSLEPFIQEIKNEVRNLEAEISFYTPYSSVFDEFNFSTIVEENVYEDNVPVILKKLSEVLQRDLELFEIEKLSPLIVSSSSDSIAEVSDFLSIDINKVNEIFTKYPFYGIKQDSVVDNKYVNSILLNAFLSDIYLEECYYEYVYLKKKEIGSTFTLSLPITLSPYEKVVVNSFYFFNLDYIVSKVPEVESYLKDLYKNTPWETKIKFINILPLENFYNFVRTNENYAIYLYNEWNKKIKGTKVWNYLTQQTFYGLQVTEVEFFYLSERLTNILNNYSAETYTVYLNYVSNLHYQNYLNIISQKQSDTRLVIKNDTTLLQLMEGKYYNPTKITYLILSPLTRVTFYANNFFLNKTVELNNTTNVSKEFDLSFIKENNIYYVSCYIVEEIYTSDTFLYKGVKLGGTPLDILSNDVTVNFGTTITLEREVPSNNLYAYYEALLWYKCNDYDFLSRQNYIYKENSKQLSFPTNFPTAWVENIGHNIFDYCEIYVDDQKIDYLDSTWLDIYNSYFRRRNQDRGYNIMIGNISSLTQLQKSVASSYLHIPLPFWFTRGYFTSLPIVSLAHTNVVIKFKFKAIKDLLVNYNSYGISVGSNIRCKLLLDFVYLDLSERLNFIRLKHNYILTQLNVIKRTVFQETNQVTFMLSFPVIDIFFFIKAKTGELIKIKTIDLVLNGVSINQVKYGDLYSLIKPHEKYYTLIDNVYIFSFALFPTEVQPSGSLNFSYVNNAIINFESETAIDETYDVYIYARNYNVLQAMSGQAALLFN